MEILIDLGRFILAIVSQAYWVIGGVVFFVVDFVTRFVPRIKIPAISWKWIGIICLCIAVFLTWRDETIKRIEKEQEIARINEPKLVGSIDGIRFLTGPGGDRLAVLMVSVINHGADSTAYNYIVAVEVSNGDPIKLQPVIMPTGLSVEMGKTVFKYSISDMLYEKTATPIKRGERRTGILVYELDELNQKRAANIGAHWRVVFKDYKDRESECVLSITKDNANAGLGTYIPGSGGIIVPK